MSNKVMDEIKQEGYLSVNEIRKILQKNVYQLRRVHSLVLQYLSTKAVQMNYEDIQAHQIDYENQAESNPNLP